MAEIVSSGDSGPGIAYEFERGVELATRRVVADYPQAKLLSAIASSPTSKGVPTIYQLSKMTVRFRSPRDTLVITSPGMYRFGPIEVINEVLVGQDLVNWPPFMGAEEAEGMARELGLKSNILSLKVFKPLDNSMGGAEKWTFTQVNGEPVTVSAVIMD